MRYSLIALALVALPALAAEKPVTVNGVAIPPARIEAGVKAMQSQGAKDGPQLRAMVKQRLIADELMVQEAKRRGLDKSEAFQQELEAARQQILARLMYSEWTKSNPVDEKTLKTEYDRITSGLGGTQFQVRHIMVGSEAEAKAILANLKKGAKFDALAKQKSADKPSAAQGGLLGWVTPGEFPPALAEGLKGMKKGQLSAAPIKSDAGWHVLKVDDTRPVKVPAFKEAKTGLTRQVQARRFNEFLSQLQSKAKIDQ